MSMLNYILQLFVFGAESSCPPKLSIATHVVDPLLAQPVSHQIHPLLRQFQLAFRRHPSQTAPLLSMDCSTVPGRSLQRSLPIKSPRCLPNFDINSGMQLESSKQHSTRSMVLPIRESGSLTYQWRSARNTARRLPSRLTHSTRRGIVSSISPIRNSSSVAPSLARSISRSCGWRQAVVTKDALATEIKPWLREANMASAIMLERDQSGTEFKFLFQGSPVMAAANIRQARGGLRQGRNWRQ